MPTRKRLIRIGCLVAAVANLLAVFFFVVRPWYLHWQANADELARTLPGDDIFTDIRSNEQTTRAITIRAPAAHVWPWLAQIGQDRAGFYSYELLEDLVGCEMPREERIHSEYQQWSIGDWLWMYPQRKIGGMGRAILAAYEPGHFMVFATRQVGTKPSEPYNGTWAFVLEPIDSESSRLIIRGRASGPRSAWGTAFDHLAFEPIHFVMERRMMEGIKAFAQGGRLSPLRDAVQIATWLGAVLLMIAAAFMTLRGPNFVEALATFFLSAVLLQWLMFGQPAPGWGVVGLVAATALLWQGRRRVRVRAESASRRSSSAPSSTV